MSLHENLLTQLKAALKQAKDQEQEKARILDEAKQGLARARDETRKLEQMLRVFQEKAEGVTKAQVRSVVHSILQRRNPLVEEELVQEVTEALVEQNAPRKGLSLMLRAVRTEFVDADGLWRLPETRSMRSQHP